MQLLQRVSSSSSCSFETGTRSVLPRLTSSLLGGGGWPWTPDPPACSSGNAGVHHHFGSVPFLEHEAGICFVFYTYFCFFFFFILGFFFKCGDAMYLLYLNILAGFFFCPIFWFLDMIVNSRTNRCFPYTVFYVEYLIYSFSNSVITYYYCQHFTNEDSLRLLSY